MAKNSHVTMTSDKSALPDRKLRHEQPAPSGDVLVMDSMRCWIVCFGKLSWFIGLCLSNNLRTIFAKRGLC